MLLFPTHSLISIPRSIPVVDISSIYSRSRSLAYFARSIYLFEYSFIESQIVKQVYLVMAFDGL